MSFLPDIPTLLAYTAACAVLFLTPGPDMSLFLAKTVSGGRRAGTAAMLGANLGCLVHTLLAAIGLSALLAASATAFALVKLVGAAYLLWLAIDAVRSGSALNLKAQRSAREPFVRTLLLGAGVNLTNPKVVLFFVTFLPQFVRAGDPDAAAKLVFLGVYYVLFSLPFAALMILGAERLLAFLKGRRGVLRAIDWTFAGVFGFFAVHILATQTR
ncbi:MAG TPA: LysE family translocator [Hyphomicrobiaceae bacterium]|jgi:threonine/homoserine/homoserine lactone efflux protein